jgi:hypothetical protein
MLPLPYSILGYHPGDFRGSRRLVFSEVHAGNLALTGLQPPEFVSDVILFRLDEGHLLLDVDGLVDRLLGKALDDAATVGFVLARHDTRLLGLAVSLGRDGRRINGEFDFRRTRCCPTAAPGQGSERGLPPSHAGELYRPAAGHLGGQIIYFKP